MNEVFIISAKRTPIGGFQGSLSVFSATRLGSIAIKAAYTDVKLDPGLIDSVYMGNVLSANLGQSPARQASIFAGIVNQTDCTTINKVCAAGMKAVMLGAQQIQLGLEDLVMVGGMESMSNVPHYSTLRKTIKLGNEINTDGLLKDGLTDAFNHQHMGKIAELTAKEFSLTREQQDDYALRSYAYAAKATKEKKFQNEIIPIQVKTIKGESYITEDEDVYKIIPEKVSKLTPTFVENGTITPANASNLNDGASAILLASAKAVEKYGLIPLAKIIGYADAATAPEAYATAPSLAIPKALKQATIKLDQVDYIELNEAYAAVVLANQRILNFDMEKTNVYGGAVAMGHPLGASGARIICTLISVLRNEEGRYGLAAICNGGGGASAMVIEKINS